MDEYICKHCGAKIVEEEVWGRVWVHVKRERCFCDYTYSTAAEPINAGVFLVSSEKKKQERGSVCS